MTTMNHGNDNDRLKADPGVLYPRPGDKSTIYLKNAVSRPGIKVGDFTIYHDFQDPLQFESRNVLYHYPSNADSLIIGKFSSIACGAKFIMNGANHRADAVSTYPFAIFGAQWDETLVPKDAWDNRGDTVIGNDVWLGFEVLVMPGVHIADGAIVASRSVVTKDVGPYQIVGGAPARLIRPRFSPEYIRDMLALKWWDWPLEKIAANLSILRGNDIDAIRALGRVPR